MCAVCHRRTPHPEFYQSHGVPSDHTDTSHIEGVVWKRGTAQTKADSTRVWHVSCSLHTTTARLRLTHLPGDPRTLPPPEGRLALRPQATDAQTHASMMRRATSVDLCRPHKAQRGEIESSPHQSPPLLPRQPHEHAHHPQDAPLPAPSVRAYAHARVRVPRARPFLSRPYVPRSRRAL